MICGRGWAHTDYCVHCCQSLLGNPSLYGGDLTVFSLYLNTVESIHFLHVISLASENFQTAYTNNISIDIVEPWLMMLFDQIIRQTAGQ